MKRFRNRTASSLFVSVVFSLSSVSASFGAEFTVPFGEYVIVDVRAASNVASTSSSQERQGRIGRSAEFRESGAEWLDGRRCTIWSLRRAGSPDFFLNDPNVSDVTLAPLDFGADTVDRRQNVPVDLVCKDLGEQILANFVIVDERVLLVPTVSGASYLVLEKPLNIAEIGRFQTILKDMKFYDGAVSGILDSQTISSIGFYAKYRGAVYRFHRVVITENLLNRLGVLEE